MFLDNITNPITEYRTTPLMNNLFTESMAILGSDCYREKIYYLSFMGHLNTGADDVRNNLLNKSEASQQTRVWIH